MVWDRCRESYNEKHLNYAVADDPTRLSGFLWGGSGLLAFEHLWHGEISPFFPFLTAANDPSEMAVAFHEMATVGTSMAVLVTAVWAVLTVVSDKILKRKPKETAKLGGDAV